MKPFLSNDTLLVLNGSEKSDMIFFASFYFYTFGSFLLPCCAGVIVTEKNVQKEMPHPYGSNVTKVI